MGWGDAFNKIIMAKKIQQDKEILDMLEAVYFGVDLAQPGTDQTVYSKVTFEDGKIKHTVIPPEEFYKMDKEE